MFSLLAALSTSSSLAGLSAGQELLSSLNDFSSFSSSLPSRSSSTRVRHLSHVRLSRTRIKGKLSLSSYSCNFLNTLTHFTPPCVLSLSQLLSTNSTLLSRPLSLPSLPILLPPLLFLRLPRSSIPILFLLAFLLPSAPYLSISST